MWDDVRAEGERPSPLHSRLQRDLSDSLEAIGRLRSLATGNQDERRLLAIVTAAPTSELFLPYTVPLVLRQAEAGGLGVDLVLGLNNGYACPDVIEGFASVPNVSIVHLRTTPKSAPHQAGSVVDAGGSRPAAIGPSPTVHRILVVHQCAGPWSAGKDLMLLDLFNGLVVPNLERGWRAPAATLVFDAEAVFTEHDPDPLFPGALEEARRRLADHGGNPIAAGRAMLASRGAIDPASERGYDIASPGLSRLLAEWRTRRVDVLGPATRFCAFGAARLFRGVQVLMPVPADPISAMHIVYNHACGVLAGCSCMSGAATLARTEVMAGILSIVLERYPDVYAEDALFTVLAEQAGLRLQFTRRVQFTNRCAGRDEPGAGLRPAWMAQFAKWYRAFNQVERLYGSGFCESVLGPSATDFLAAGIAIAARQIGDRELAEAFLHEVAHAGAAFAEIRGMVAAGGSAR